METEARYSYRDNRVPSYAGSSAMDRYDSKAGLSYNTKTEEDANCCHTCSKRFLFGVNLILFVVGLALIIVGVYILDNDVSYEGFGNIDLFCWFAISSGILVSLVGFCGCASAASQNRCVLIIFIGFLVFILLAEIALIIFSFVLQETLKDELEDQWDNSTIDERNAIEDELGCCTFDDPSSDTSCDANAVGCYQKLKDELETYIEIVLIVAIAVAVYDIVMIVVATCLCKKRNNNNDDV